MTAPSTPDGDDDVVRYVFQAVADYSALIRETRKAKAETRALKREIDGIAGAKQVTVTVRTDTGTARSELARLARDLVVKARVVLDAVAARAELAKLSATTVKVRATLDTGALTAMRTALARLKDLAVTVAVRVDRATIAALRADLAKLRDLVVTVSVRADGGALAALSARLSRIRDLTVAVAVRVDDAALDALRTRLAALTGLTVKVAVEVDDTAITRATTARTGRPAPPAAGRAGLLDRIGGDDTGSFNPAGLLADLFDKLRDYLRNERRRADRTAEPATGPGQPGADRDTDRAESRLNRLGSQVRRQLPDGLQRILTLTLLWGTALSTVGPLVAGLSLAIASLLPGLLAAGAAFAIFGAAAVGALVKVTKAVEEYGKAGTIVEGLDSPLGQVVLRFAQLKQRYAEFTTATEQPVFRVFNTAMDLASTLLDKVEPRVGNVAAAVEGLFRRAQRAAAGPGFEEFLDFADRQGPNAIAKLSAGFGGLLAGLGKLIMAFEPFGRTFVDGFADAGAAFNRWAGDLGSNTTFQRFLDYAADRLPEILDLLGALLDAAVNLAVGLAPVGEAVLSIATAFLTWLAGLDPSTITGFAVAVIALTAAVKGLLIVSAVARALPALQAALAATQAGLARMGVSASLATVALRGLGAALAIGYVVAAATAALKEMRKAQEEAAAAAARHRDRLKELAPLVAQTGGVDSAEVRRNQYEDLTSQTVKGSSGGVVNSITKALSAGLVDGATYRDVNLGQIAREAGISTDDLITGSTGKNTQAQARNIGKLETLRRSYQDKALNAGSAQEYADARATADGIEKLIQAYQSGSFAAGELADAADEVAKSNQEVTGSADAAADGVKRQAVEYATAAEQAKAVREALAQDPTADVSYGLYDKATSALDAYTDGLDAAADSERSLEAAHRSAERAQQAVTDARRDAVQRIKDVQRALRDLSLDERQVNLTAKQSQERLDRLIANGGTADEIEQARIDNERAQNAREDFRQDRKPKTDRLTEELGKGVEGNKGLQDAIQASKDAEQAVTDAATAADKAKANLRRLDTAAQQAAGALGLTTAQVRKLRGQMNRITDKTIKVVADTADAEAKIRALLQGRYALQLMAADPTLTPDQAWAQAGSMLPKLAGATPARNAGLAFVPGGGAAGGAASGAGFARGGATTAVASPVTAGPVYGPGTGTSDSIAVDLPVGGKARLSAGEHIVTDGEVRAAGGHQVIEALRAAWRSGREWRRQAPAFTAPDLSRRAWSATLPGPRVPGLPNLLPGYAGGGAVAALRATPVPAADRSRTVTINGGISVTNAVPERASTSLYREIRKVVDGDDE